MQKSLSLHLLRMVITLAVLTFTLPLPAAQAASDGIDSIELVVRTPNYGLTETGVSVTGYAIEDAPGMPLLPVYGVLVELPASGDWEISYQSINDRVLDQHVAIRSVPAPNLSLTGPESWTQRADEDLPSSVPVVDRPDPGVYGTNGFYPSSLITSKEIVWQEGRRLLPLRVYPFQYNPITGELRYHPEIRIQVKTKTSAAAVQPEAALVSASEAAPQAVTGTGGTLRVRTAAAGMYRLTYDDLVAKGVPLATTDIATFAMTYLGQPVDIQVVGDGDNRLESGELVVFYAEAYTGRYGTNNVYFFSYGGATGGRMASRTVTPTGAEPVLTSIIRTARVEEDKEYHSDYPISQTADHFFDLPLSVDAVTTVSTRPYSLNLVNPITSGNITFRGRFYGGLDQGVNPDQSVQVSLNKSNQVLGTFQWRGQTGYNATATKSASWLNSPSNTLTFLAEQRQLPSLAGYSIYIDWVELDYPALAAAQADRLYIKGLNLTGTSVQVQTTGFTTGQVTVYDIRDGRHPVVIGRTQVSGTGPFNLAFWDAWAAGVPAASYFLTTQAALAVPVAVEVASLPGWNTAANNYDYIAIVHRTLWDAVQPLLNHRAAQGLRVAKVDVQDIYDAYSGGLVDPEAIRTFLTYAYRNWNSGGGATRPPAPPKYVLLVGDGHYDFKNVTGTTQLNLIPPYLISVDPWIGETAADNRYVSVDAASDFMPEMAIGRIPAQSASEVTIIVNKILAYEDPSRIPNGAWQSKVTFVADQADDPAGDFQALSEDVRRNWLPATYTSQPTIYWEKDYTVVADMTAAITASFPNSVMVQWFGHGSKFRWGNEVSLFNVAAITNSPPGQRWPFSADYTCWSGYFINLFNASQGYQTVAEAALLTQDKGSAAVLAPSGLHIGSSLLTLNQGVVKAVFQDRVQPIGAAMNAAKAFYYANTGGGDDLLDTMIFFGDPAMPLRLPGTVLATPPAVSIARSTTPSAVDLTWAHVAADSAYDVWRGTTPYFDPAAGQGVRVSTVDAGIASAGAKLTAIDDGTDPPPAVQVIGNPAQNYFWVVRGRNSSSVSSNSNRTGEFDFQLVPGS
jgi:hypothetical protein